MVTFTCPTCGIERTGVRRRCYPCTVPRLDDDEKEWIRQRVRASWQVPDADQRRANIKAGVARKRAEGWTSFNLAAHMATQPHPFARPGGSERTNKDGRVWVKVLEHGPTNKAWKRRYHVVWEAVHGPVPRGRLLHHRNENPGDDRLENLQLVTRAQHMKIHMTREKLQAAQLLAVEARKAKLGGY